MKVEILNWNKIGIFEMRINVYLIFWDFINYIGYDFILRIGDFLEVVLIIRVLIGVIDRSGLKCFFKVIFYIVV